LESNQISEEEEKKLLEEIKDAEEELKFLSEYHEILECDLEELKNGGVYSNILERIQQQIVKAEKLTELMDKSTDEEQASVECENEICDLKYPEMLSYDA